jgi:hypothetical protein
MQRFGHPLPLVMLDVDGVILDLMAVASNGISKPRRDRCIYP